MQKEMSFKEKVNGQTDKTDHNSSPRASGSGELKSLEIMICNLKHTYFLQHNIYLRNLPTHTENNLLQTFNYENS